MLKQVQEKAYKRRTRCLLVLDIGQFVFVCILNLILAFRLNQIQDRVLYYFATKGKSGVFFAFLSVAISICVPLLLFGISGIVSRIIRKRIRVVTDQYLQASKACGSEFYEYTNKVLDQYVKQLLKNLMQQSGQTSQEADIIDVEYEEIPLDPIPVENRAK